MRYLLTALLSLAMIQQSRAHYHILLPDKPSAKTGEKVTLTYQFGHPFEHQLFDADAPAEAYVLAPDGKKIDLLESMKEVTLEKKKAFTFTFVPEVRGDYIAVVATKEFKLEDEKLPLSDLARVVVHVQAQKGWERSSNPDKPLRFDAVPLTRPYGLRAGMVFRFNATRPLVARGSEKGVPNLLVEVEKYNPAPPKEMPSDELITFTCRTDSQGVAATTLPDPGWWAVTCISPSWEKTTTLRVTQWVLVDK